MISEFEVIRMLMDIDESSNKMAEIRMRIRDMIDRIEAEKKPEPNLLRGDLLPPKQSGGVKQKFDKGKMMALRRAGWTVKAIADEMKCSEATIYNHMKKEGTKE